MKDLTSQQFIDALEVKAMIAKREILDAIGPVGDDPGVQYRIVGALASHAVNIIYDVLGLGDAIAKIRNRD